MKTKFLSIVLASLMFPTLMTAREKLTGTPIGTSAGYDYEQGKVVQNIQGRAFDGDLNTYFATNERSYTWVGLDLGKPYVIDKVGWSPRNDGVGPERVQLGVIQGANQEDWLDAVPLYIITEKGTIGKMDYADVTVNKGFRYVRFVSTGNSRCNIAELEFYGTEGEGDDSAPNLFQVTNLPTVCINTVDAQEPYDKEHDITSNIIIINDHEAYVDKPGTVRERGNASRNFPKKPWRIKFDKKQQVLPDAPAKCKKWTLINNYGDKTLMRNLVAFEIARRLEMKFVPYAHAVDVILNGEYKGCYQLCDQVEVNPGRVEITEMEETDIEGDALTGGYLVEVDAYAYDEPAGEWFTTNEHKIPVTIKSPDPGITQQYNYIKSYFEKLESSVFSNTDIKGGTNDYRNIFEVESFLRHFMVGELSGNTDTYWSTYMYKDRGDDKIYTGPVWDFDIAFDNDYRTYPINNIKSTYLYDSGKASAANQMREFVNRIIKNDPRTKDDIKRIWSLARNDNNLTYESLEEYMDDKAKELDASQKLNFLRWPIMNESVHMNPVLSGSYTAEVKRVKDYLKGRLPILDKLMGYDKTITDIKGITTAEGKIIPVVNDNRISMKDNIPFEVYNAGGSKIFSGKGSTHELPSGIYIVKAKSAVVKIAL